MKFTNLFIIVFFLALAYTVVTDGKNWPFMAYDMYSGNFPQVEFVGTAASGKLVPLSGDSYFSYFKGLFFSHAMSNFYSSDPARFSRIAHELKLRYNAGAVEKLDYLRAYYINTGDRRELPGAYF